MSPMIAGPLAIPQGTEQEMDLEFELDIRISTSKTSVPTFATQDLLTNCNTCTCGTCSCSCDGACGTTHVPRC